MATVINVEDIITDAGTQARARMESGTIDEYAEAMKEGAAFPPVLVFEDGDGALYLADGFHRLSAVKQLKHTTIAAIVERGGKRDALLYALGANAEHGLQRTNWDKRRAVELALQDPELSQESNREIARICKVDEKTVRNVKKEEETRLARKQEIADKEAARRDQWDADYPQHSDYWEMALRADDEVQARIDNNPELDLLVLAEAADRVPGYRWQLKKLIDTAIRKRAGDDLSDIKHWDVDGAKWRLESWAAADVPFLSEVMLPIMLRVEKVYQQRPDVIEALEGEIKKRLEAHETPEALAKAAAQKQAMQIKNGSKGVHNIETDAQGIAGFDMYLYSTMDSDEITKAVEKLMEVTGGNQRYRLLVRRA